MSERRVDIYGKFYVVDADEMDSVIATSFYEDEKTGEQKQDWLAVVDWVYMNGVPEDGPNPTPYVRPAAPSAPVEI